MAESFAPKALVAQPPAARCEPAGAPRPDTIAARAPELQAASCLPSGHAGPALPIDVRIRLMGPPDLAAYKTLRDLMLAAHPEAFSSDADTELRRPPETYLARVAGVGDGGWPFTVTAWRGEWLCGAVTCERDSRLKVRHIGRIVGMMVHPAACGRGIGRALLEASVGLCLRRGGVELLTLSVTSGSVAAIGLYERAGFVRYGRLERAVRIGTQFHHKDLMVRQLGANG
jgi:ribosomal protein S18 acetylase RimI-like enzyme